MFDFILIFKIQNKHYGECALQYFVFLLIDFKVGINLLLLVFYLFMKFWINIMGQCILNIPGFCCCTQISSSHTQSLQKQSGEFYIHITNLIEGTVSVKTRNSSNIIKDCTKYVYNWRSRVAFSPRCPPLYIFKSSTNPKGHIFTNRLYSN